jgi:hypothetical protein
MIGLWVIRHYPGWRLCHPIYILFLLLLVLVFGRLLRWLCPLYQRVIVQFNVGGRPPWRRLPDGLHLDRRWPLLPLLRLWLKLVLHRIIIAAFQVLQSLLRDLVAANLNVV